MKGSQKRTRRPLSMTRSASLLWTGLTAGILAGGLSATPAHAQDLYVSSLGTNSVKHYDGVTGAFLGDIVASGSGGLSTPYAVAMGPDGKLVVSTGNNGTILRYDGTTGAFLDTFASGIVTYAFTWQPDGNLYVANGSSGGVLRSSGTTANTLTPWATTGGYLGTGIAFGADGSAYVADLFNGQIRKYSSTGSYLGVFATGAGSPEGLMFGPDGNLYVTDNTGNRVIRYDGTTGALIGAFGAATFAGSGLDGPDDLTFGPGGDLLVTSMNNSRVLRYDGTTGAFLGTFGQANAGGSGLSTPTRLFYSTPQAPSVPEPGAVAGGAACLLAGGLGWLRLRSVRRRR